MSTMSISLLYIFISFIILSRSEIGIDFGKTKANIKSELCYVHFVVVIVSFSFIFPVKFKWLMDCEFELYSISIFMIYRS